MTRLGFSAVHRNDVLLVAGAFLAFVKKRVASVDVDDVRAFLAARREHGVSATTQAGELSRLRTFFAALVRLGLASRDPTEGMWVRRSTPVRLVVSEKDVGRLLEAALSVPLRERVSLVKVLHRERRPLAADEVEPVFLATAKRDRAALELLYGLALRSAELRAARVTDLDLVDGTLLVRRAKRGEPERLPLPPALIPPLRAWLEARPLLARGEDEGRLLVRNDGRPYAHASGVNKLVNRVAARARVSVHPHALRRGVATHLVRAGTSIAAVQRLLGHQKLDTTAIYVGVSREELAKAVATLDRTPKT